MSGIENLVEEPIDLTDMDGFEHFRMKCGNFAYGLQSMKNKEFYREVIGPLLKTNRIKKKMNYSQWIDEFIEKEENKYANAQVLK